MILRALQGDERLLVNSTTKKLLIGNDVFISERLWDRVKKPVNLSIMVKELAHEIWGCKKCAEYSLCGGKSPRTPEAALKPAAPAGAVEAIFGVFRAKKMLDGLTNEKHLEEAMSQAETALRGKFADCVKKVKKEKNEKEEEQAALAVAAEERT